MRPEHDPASCDRVRSVVIKGLIVGAVLGLVWHVVELMMRGWP